MLRTKEYLPLTRESPIYGINEFRAHTKKVYVQAWHSISFML
jgi:hypothetical protein